MRFVTSIAIDELMLHQDKSGNNNTKSALLKSVKHNNIVLRLRACNSSSGSPRPPRQSEKCVELRGVIYISFTLSEVSANL